MNGERGAAASVEAAVILPAILLFVALLLSLGRLALADQHVGAAASAAARAAALERTVPAAERAADEALSQALAERDLACRTVFTAVDAAGVARALGEVGTVSVKVTCAVELSDISLPGVPGTVSVSATRDAPVDPLRGR
ncbi:MAG TPA: TadE/TadG family type IV pilus assembly protein [Arachnia sp.]|nr:TadE/TadG family type IV pilus assembly protein [Arachnia sp.]HQD21755.1 TadE/TadG family type IV pilus assembly protein [Arachnia sp.]